MDDSLYTRFDKIFFEKTRLSMVTILYREEKTSFKQLKKILKGSDGAVYTHLEKLLAGGYIRKKKEIVGTEAQTAYTLTSKGKKTFKEYLNFIQTILETQQEESQ